MRQEILAKKPSGAKLSEDTDTGLRIIEAAAQAFMLEGFALTSIDDIARLLGCTKGLIYYHFKNKTDLFFAVHRRGMDMNLGNVRPIALGEGTPTEKMNLMVRKHIEGVFERIPFQRISLVGLEMQVIGRTSPEERVALDDLISMHREYENLFVDVIAEGIKSGEFASGDARVVAKPVLGAMNWMIMWYQPRPKAGRAALDKLREEIASYILRGLAATPPGRGRAKASK
jgi:AcrR family transcriptional regulator